MNGVARITAGAGYVLLAILILSSFPARADKQVIFSPLTDGPDFDEAMAFFSGHFKDDPEIYTSKAPAEKPGDARALSMSLGLYLRKVVRVGKADITDDGMEERFYFMGGADPFSWCGSRGCTIFIVQKQSSGWKVLCEVSGGEHGVGITDWMSTSGYRELKATFRVYWHGGKCYDDDPELLNEYGPEHYPRPSAERIWKPIQ